MKEKVSIGGSTVYHITVGSIHKRIHVRPLRKVGEGET